MVIELAKARRNYYLVVVNKHEKQRRNQGQKNFMSQKNKFA